MTTSGTYSFYVTRDDIVREALLNIKKIDGIDPIESNTMADCVRKLNLMIKQWQGKADFAPGLKVWTRKRGHLFLHAFTGTYPLSPTLQGWADSYTQTYSTANLAGGATAIPVSSLAGIMPGNVIGIELDTGDMFWSTVASLGSLTANLTTPLPSSSVGGSVVFCYLSTPQAPLLVEAAYLRDININDTPLNILQQRDWDFLPNKQSPSNFGDPTAIYVETQLGYTNVYTDVAGSNDVSKHIVLTYMQPVQDIVNNTDTPYYPQEWYNPLCWGLAKQCAPMFNAKWTDLMQSNYVDSLAIAQRKDPEIETRFFQCGE